MYSKWVFSFGLYWDLNLGLRLVKQALLLKPLFQPFQLFYFFNNKSLKTRFGRTDLKFLMVALSGEAGVHWKISLLILLDFLKSEVNIVK